MKTTREKCGYPFSCNLIAHLQLFCYILTAEVDTEYICLANGENKIILDPRNLVKSNLSLIEILYRQRSDDLERLISLRDTSEVNCHYDVKAEL